MKIPDHLQALNFPASQLDAFLISLEDWSYAIGNFIERHGVISSVEELEKAAEFAWSFSGLRCHAFETLDRYLDRESWPRAISNIRACAVFADEVERLKVPLTDLANTKKGLTKLLHWIDAEGVATPGRHHCTKWRTWKGASVFIDPNIAMLGPAPSPPPMSPSQILKRASSSQKNAIRQIVDLVRVKDTGWTLGGIRPRTTALLVGLSGSGKTWLAEAAANVADLSFFSTSIGSWHPYGGRVEQPTGELLRRHLAEHGRGLIFIDEIDKIRKDAPDNLNYSGFLWDELMGVLDGRVNTWPRWSYGEIEALKKSSIVMAGAFQDLYRAEVGRTIMFEEDVQSIHPLTFDQIVSAEWLPEELLNRAGSLIEIRPPDKSEIRERLEQIDKDAGIECSEVERERTSRMIATGLQGMRGLENYALQLALNLVRKDSDEGLLPS